MIDGRADNTENAETNSLLPAAKPKRSNVPAGDILLTDWTTRLRTDRDAAAPFFVHARFAASVFL